MKSENASAALLSEKNRVALAKLLDDDDASAIRLLEESFRAKGEQGAAVLNQIIAEGPALARKNAQAILLTVQREAAVAAFARFCADGDDLETGVFLLARTRYPTFALEKYARQLDETATELRGRIFPDDPKLTIEAINQHLFVELGFHGNAENYYDPDNSFINRVLDRRTGIPITLAAVYLFVAKRLGLPIAGVGMPGHFIVKWTRGTGVSEDDIFIDPFNQGRLLTIADCVDFLKRSGQVYSPDMLTSVKARQILARMCNNLVAVYRQQDETQLAGEYERFAATLSSR